jgi:class 3 adenylate cyclase
VKTTGNGILIEFPSVIEAVRCAVEVQRGMIDRNAVLPQEKRIEFRVTYKSKAVDAKQIGRDLGVRYVLEGSVQRSANQIRVNAQLIDAETGSHLWGDFPPFCKRFFCSFYQGHARTTNVP